MSLATDLLDQAEWLAKREPKNPKQASLRRAVSAAYYGLFHLLVEEAARFFATAIGRTDPATIARLARTFDHALLKDVSNRFKQSQLPVALQSSGYVIPDDLKLVAKVFTDLQDARHIADYDTARTLTRTEVQDHIRDVSRAIEAWNRVRETAEARMYLACFSLWKSFNTDRAR
jgi:uncharacterized protein (UPF0332 family)